MPGSHEWVEGSRAKGRERRAHAVAGAVCLVVGPVLTGGQTATFWMERRTTEHRDARKGTWKGARAAGTATQLPWRRTASAWSVARALPPVQVWLGPYFVLPAGVLLSKYSWLFFLRTSIWTF